MNLLIDDWIPVKKEDTPKQITYKELLCTDYPYKLSHPRDDMELGALQLLLCLTQSIFMPNNRDELVVNIKTPMNEAKFDQGIKDYIKWFSLDDPKYPFMQDVSVSGKKSTSKQEKAKGETTKIQKLFANMPVGPGSATLFNSSKEIEQICPSCAAIGMMELTTTPSWSGGYITGLRGESPVTVLVHDFNLRKMIWKNVLDKEWKDKNWPITITEYDSPTWIEHIQEKSRNLAHNIGMLRGLFWQSIRMLLIWDHTDTPVICSCCRKETNIFCKDFLQSKFSFKHGGSIENAKELGVWRHPHSPYIYKDNIMRVVSMKYDNKFNMPFWSRLNIFLSHPTDSDFDSSLSVKHYYRELRNSIDDFNIVIGAYRNKSANANIIERRHEIISISSYWIKDDDSLQNLHLLIHIAMLFYEKLWISAYSLGYNIQKLKANSENIDNINQDFKKLENKLDKDKSNNISKNMTSKVNALFFQKTEHIIHKNLVFSSEYKVTDTLNSEIKFLCLEIFDEISEPYLINSKVLKLFLKEKFKLQNKIKIIIQN